MKRKATGIWACSACDKKIVGGAYTMATAAGTTVRANIARLRRAVEG